MAIFRRIVVAVLLAVMFFPAVASAESEPAASPPVISAPVSGSAAGISARSGSAEVAGLATRERQAGDLGNFKGGAAYIYVGSSAVLILVIILLILII
jgi:hypothetical protein